MRIRKVTIRNFGKWKEKTIAFSDGICLVTGENESGKSTLHTFFQSMLFGMTRGRGRGARNDTFSRYEPWENPSYYAGELVFESGGKEFRLIRNFSRGNTLAQLVCLTDGEVLSVEDGDLSVLLGEISETAYENTASAAQKKIRTEEGLVEELRNYMANSEQTGDAELDVAAALTFLNRKKTEQQKKELLEGKNRKKEELETRCSLLREEWERLNRNRNKILTQLEKGQTAELEEKRIRAGRPEFPKKPGGKGFFFMGCLFLVAAPAFLLSLFLRSAPLRIVTGGLLLCSAGLFFCWFRKQKEELMENQNQERKAADAEQQELRWKAAHLQEELQQKQTELANLESACEELAISLTEKTDLDFELDAIRLAADTIRELSVQLQNRMGETLRKRMSSILCELTGGKYQKVSLSENLEMVLHTEEASVPLEKVSSGTLEQAYFALRMAAMDVFCEEEELPVLLDEPFSGYDRTRLKEALLWLSKNRSQVLLFTCSDREEQALQELSLPYQKIQL